MTAITQKIRRFTGGISDQPDEQKIPGQVRDAVNCVPDVVQGLIKRPGLNLVNNLNTNKNGKWFFIDKANNFNDEDRYVGQISNTTGKVKVWDLKNGKLMDVCYTDNIDPLDIKSSLGGIDYNVPEYAGAYACESEGGNPSEDYFKKNSPQEDDLQVLTINDYTFVTNRKVPVEMSVNSAAKRKPEATVELRSLAGLTEYTLEFDGPSSSAGSVQTKATELTISGTGYNNTAPACSSKCNSVFTKGGIQFRVITTAITVPFADETVIEDRCVYTTKVEIIDGGTNAKVGDTFTVQCAGVTYKVTVQAVSRSVTTSTGLGKATVTSDRENPDAEKILNSLRDQIRGLGGFTCDRIGNSLYIRRSQPFTVTTPNNILLRTLSATAISDEGDSHVVQANDISEVPLQTKHNLIFQIRNSFNEADDYYVQFKGDNDQDGTGTYVEVAKPGLAHVLEPDSMPHGILRLSKTRRDSEGDVIVTFLVASFKWASRAAGDDVTNPRPSFAPEIGAEFGRPINQLAFFRNRLVLLSDENVVCSVAGDFFNFWGKTAQAISPSDPIDLQVSNNYPAVLYAAQSTTAGLILFSENAQFMFGTENDVLEPRTARTSMLSTYNFNRNSNPISLGTTVGFVSGIGRYTRLYEMANISRDQEPEVVEQTKVVERLIPGGYQFVGISKDNQLVALGQKDLDEVWLFRYFNTGERRVQSAWCRWKLTGDLVNHALINDSYFSVVFKDGEVFLLRGDVRALSSTIMLQNDGEDYRTFIDYATAVEKKTDDKPGYTESTNNKITIDPDKIGFPIFDDIKDKLISVVWDPADEQGYIVKPSYKDGKIVIRSDIENQKIFIGYTFDMRVDLPKFYVKKEESNSVQSWDTANVIVQRVKLNFGRIGYYQTTLKRLGRPDYTQEYESKPMDKYDANELGYLPDYEQTTPIYQRNTDFTMSIHAEHPAPAVIYSATWEGQYQENYVKRL